MEVSKYSIVIPVNNVIHYLPATIDSIISQNYTDYELIISDDNSTDGTAEYIDSLNHPNIKAIHTPQRFTMAEHFDWALSHAVGAWCMFVGGDDGLQPYFFQLVDRLTEIATKKNIRAIASRRAYFFWNGCQSVYGDVAVSYSATKKYRVKSSKKEMYKVLYSRTMCGYFELPQMYTSSIFHCSLIDEIREKQAGKLIDYGIADAFLAALSTSIEKKYLYSDIPLGWIGTSPKVFIEDYVNMTLSQCVIHQKCGSVNLRNTAIYYLGALLSINFLNKKNIKILTSPLMMYRLAANAYITITGSKNFAFSEEYKHYLDFLTINNLHLSEVLFLVKLIKMKNNFSFLLDKIFSFPCRCVRYILKRIPRIKQSLNLEVHVNIGWSQCPNMTMKKASEIVIKLINQSIHFEDLKL